MSVKMTKHIPVANADHRGKFDNLRLRNEDNVCIFATSALQANGVFVCCILFLTEDDSGWYVCQLLVFKDTEEPHGGDTLWKS